MLLLQTPLFAMPCRVDRYNLLKIILQTTGIGYALGISVYNLKLGHRGVFSSTIAHNIIRLLVTYLTNR